MLRRVAAVVVFAASVLWAGAAPAAALELPGPLADLQTQMRAISNTVPGMVGIAICDLATGTTSGVNANVEMPAASTIKIPVMIEVFRQMALSRVTLTEQVTLQQSDRDDGWGDLYDAPVGTSYSVSNLLRLMITESDNTATNMLIRLVGRTNINAEMQSLGLHHTRLGDYIRSEGDIRSLRSSPFDMAEMLTDMAQDKLVDDWSSRAMITILAGQHHNGLLPAPLPRGIEIAHKTGTLHDTLNDVGIVYYDPEPYVIAVMTTHLPDLDIGRSFIHGVSKLAYNEFSRFATWRIANGIPAFNPSSSTTLNAGTSNAPSPVVDPAAPTSDEQTQMPDEKTWESSAKTNPPASSDQ